MIPLQHGLILAAILFVLGLTGLVIRRNLLFMLIGLEIMINASALAFVVAGSYWGQTDGQVMYILAISLAAAEASIGLALLLQLHRRRQNLNIDSVSEKPSFKMYKSVPPAFSFSRSFASRSSGVGVSQFSFSPRNFQYLGEAIVISATPVSTMKRYE